MIVRNYEEHWIGCDICEEVTEISRRVRANPETVLIMMQHLKHDHSECEQYKHDPRQAAVHRGYKRRLREEMNALNSQKKQRMASMIPGELL